MSQKAKTRQRSTWLSISLWTAFGINLLVVVYLSFLVMFQGRIFPGVKVAQVNLNHYTPDDATQAVEQTFNHRTQTIILSDNRGHYFSLNLANSQPKNNLDNLINSAYQVGRSGNLVDDFRHQLSALIFGVNFPMDVSFDKLELLQADLDNINNSIKQTSLDASVSLANPITISPSKNGVELDKELLFQQIKSFLSFDQPEPKILPTRVVNPKFTTQDGEKARQILQAVKNSPIQLTYQNSSWTIDQPTLYKILNFHQDQSDKVLSQVEGESATADQLNLSAQQIPEGKLQVDTEKSANFLSTISDQINQPVQEAKFNLQPATDTSKAKVIEFQPAKSGLELDVNQTISLINQDLANSTPSNISLPVTITQPKLTTENINNFGVKELIGQGQSNFAGSIDNRVYNIKLAASRINGSLVPPGEVFSFNSTVGDISGASGYKEAYIIKSGRTVLDDGGGVCQVSTTLFRAALNSGLPIIARTAHAYRVGYYEQGYPPGLDATVFAPSVDFKFKNDTPSYVLIQTYTIGQSLYIDFYGTSDGRVATLSTPKVTNNIPPLPAVRQDDPTLPKGIIKQVDWPAWGAKVTFSRSVTRDGQTISQETWTSNFQPWQAIYLVGTM